MAKESGIEAIVSKATFARVLSCVSSKETGGAVLGVLRMRFGTVGEVIAVEGKTAMADAMHCQRKACRRVIQRKGDYPFGLKENQQALLEDVRLFFDHADEKEIDSFQTVEKNAGRIEKRAFHSFRL